MKWEAEKQKGIEFIKELTDLLINNNLEEFKVVYTKSMRYTTKKQRTPLYKQYLILSNK